MCAGWSPTAAAACLLAAGPGPRGGLCWSCGRHSSSKAVCGVCSANQALSWWLAGRAHSSHACGSSGCMIPVRFQDPSLGLVLLLLSPSTHNQLWQYSALLLFSCPQRRGCLGSVFVVCRVCLHLLSALCHRVLHLQSPRITRAACCCTICHSYMLPLVQCVWVKSQKLIVTLPSNHYRAVRNCTAVPSVLSSPNINQPSAGCSSSAEPAFTVVECVLRR